MSGAFRRLLLLALLDYLRGLSGRPRTPSDGSSTFLL